MQNPIIPIQPVFYQTDASKHWDLRAICVFAATGFFLDRDTYHQDKKVVRPGVDYQLDSHDKLLSEQPYFNWHYNPRDISFNRALGEFTDLFETIIDEQLGDKKVILPLSGGLDSRTQAVALKHLGKEVSAFSYRFKGGYPETAIGRAIAHKCGFPFNRFEIEEGYLWKVIDRLAVFNGCYSEFTHPRQMAVKDRLGELGEVFSLGHWGDVLFDKGVPEHLLNKDLAAYALKKIIKKGGLELADALWKYWGLEGNFEAYLSARISTLLANIDIDHPGAKFRAFKSLYWAPRWTSVNLSVFASERPVTLPYYDNRMCEFICTVPEEYLAGRKLQIAYIKKRDPDLARITWQQHKPFNLYNYHLNRLPYNLPYRLLAKAGRELKGVFGKPYVQRNWELQFLGESNRKELESYLFDSSLNGLISRSLIEDFYDRFYTNDPVYYSHPLSMLLTLAVRIKHFARG